MLRAESLRYDENVSGALGIAFGSFACNARRSNLFLLFGLFLFLEKQAQALARRRFICFVPQDGGVAYDHRLLGPLLELVDPLRYARVPDELPPALAGIIPQASFCARAVQKRQNLPEIKCGTAFTHAREQA